jgi:hypothetical protein
MDAATLDEPLSRVTPAEMLGNIWLITTHWHAEKHLCEELAEQGIQTYQPRQSTRRWYKVQRKTWNHEKGQFEIKTKSQWKDWEVTIFPFVVFAADAGRPFADMFYAISDTNRVQRQADSGGIKLIKNQPRIRRDLETFDIIYRAGLGYRLQHIGNFGKGTPCKVCAGPLEGVVGRVEEVKGKNRLRIEIKATGQCRGYPLDISAENVEAISESEYAME